MKRETAAISPISEIIAAVRGGEIVILVDDEDRENEGDLVFAAEFVTAEKINFLAKHGRGLVCMSITEIVAAIRAGEIVILVDDEDRENEGDLVFAAEYVSAEKITLPSAARNSTR